MGVGVGVGVGDGVGVGWGVGVGVGEGVGAEEQCGGSVGGKVPLPAIALMYLILVLQSEMSTR